LNARIDDLEAKNFSMRAKADGLTNEVTQLKAESTKAQELATKH
jgi:hypothetical protein